MAVCRVLKRYDALEDVQQDEEEAETGGEGSVESRGGRIEPKPTAFGRMLGAINAENQLWMALVLTRYVTCLTPDRPRSDPDQIAVSSYTVVDLAGKIRTPIPVIFLMNHSKTHIGMIHIGMIQIISLFCNLLRR